MIGKRCPFCGGTSYSSYDDPDWVCPYCEKKIGQKGEDVDMSRKRYFQNLCCPYCDSGNIKINPNVFVESGLKYICEKCRKQFNRPKKYVFAKIVPGATVSGVYQSPYSSKKEPIL